jgi:5-methylcytosine-specific restriction endonuclease McrBC regulatory subunit McrC
MTELGDTVALIVRAFVAEVRRYVGAGREWRYEQRRMVSSLAGGRLNVPATISLRSRGLRHLMAFDTPTVTRAIEINRVIFAALSEVEVLAKLVSIDPITVAGARAMSMYFDDCRDAESIYATRTKLVQRVNDVLDDPVWSAHRDMLSFAGVLLSHGSLEPASPLTGVVPISWFVNLENLFERAVRQELALACGSEATVGEGSSYRRMVFPVVGSNQANPDLFVQLVSDAVVGDVKYKTWTRTASPSDLYQLLVHASAFDSARAFLVYPSDRFDQVEMKVATTGAQVWLFAIDIRSIASDLRRVCSQLAIPTSSVGEGAAV